MQILTIEIKKKKEHRETLLLECLPPSVTQQMLETHNLEAGLLF